MKTSGRTHVGWGRRYLHSTIQRNVDNLFMSSDHWNRQITYFH